MDVLSLTLLSYLLYFITSTIGITFGYHRFYAHQTFTTSVFHEILILYCGMLCGCKSPLTWVGVHRMHHTYSDTPKDPHSRKYLKWYVILFSLWKVKNIPRKFIKDVIKNQYIVFVHKNIYLLYAVNAFILFLLFGIDSIIILSLISLLSYIGFGALNLWGHTSTGTAKNCFWLNFIAPFEGDHHTHHINASK